MNHGAGCSCERHGQACLSISPAINIGARKFVQDVSSRSRCSVSRERRCRQIRDMRMVRRHHLVDHGTKQLSKEIRSENRIKYPSGKESQAEQQHRQTNAHRRLTLYIRGGDQRLWTSLGNHGRDQTHQGGHRQIVELGDKGCRERLQQKMP